MIDRLIYFYAWCVVVGVMGMYEKLLTGIYPFFTGFIIVFSICYLIERERHTCKTTST